METVETPLVPPVTPKGRYVELIARGRVEAYVHNMHTHNPTTIFLLRDPKTQAIERT